MTTLRKELTDLGFDFTNGRIRIFLDKNKWGGELYVSIHEIEVIEENYGHILDTDFRGGIPQFIAEDDKFIYMPEQYDAETRVFRVAKDINSYNKENLPPYPGG